MVSSPMVGCCVLHPVLHVLSLYTTVHIYIFFFFSFQPTTSGIGHRVRFDFSLNTTSDGCESKSNVP